jgi:RNA polymerase sigma factor (sigma-70 family)
MEEWQLQQIMDEHAEYLLKVAYVYTKNWAYAEEVVQDVFFKFYKRSEQFEGRAKLRTYLVKMTANQAQDYLKSWRYKKELLLESLHVKSLEHRFTTQPFEVALEQSGLIQKMMHLPVQSRAILYLYYYEEMTIRELSELLKITEGNVRTKLSRARVQLKDIYSFQEKEVFPNG